ncbi:MAG: pantothenate metabolism flavoprotein, phosphopantothenoylcysteine decarboxylase / phosphopantothenate-cysteine ligase, partial [Candidatus Peregrinibacteria bacterium GW2011_GWE2_39_6]
ILLYAKKLLTIQDLKGKKVLISAGRTVESIDPVRILTNRSSGKMGLAFAKTAFLRGAKVIVISGAVEIKYPEVPNLEVFFVESTQEMNVAILKYFPKTDMFISAAAVCDYAPVQTLLSKHKKSKNKGMIWNLFLKENPNILGKVLQKKKSGQKIVAFALETDEVFKNAKKKFMSSGIDYLVANEPGVIGQEQGQFIIFEKNHNEIVFLDKFALSSLIFDRLGV